MNTLLDYFFKITAINPTPAASTAFLKQVCLVVNPKSGVTPGTPTLCTSMSAVAALTDNTNAQQLFNAGMTRVYILPMDDLDLETAMVGHDTDFYTVLISDDFAEVDITQTAATGTVTITGYASLTSTTPDTLNVAGTTFTASSSAVTLGQATFRASTDNATTAASLVAQINGHATAGALVTASAEGAVVTITANELGYSGNDLVLAYTDSAPTSVGLTLSGLVDGKLSGGSGLFLGTFSGVCGVSSDDDTFLTAQAVIERRCAFKESGTTNAKNMCYAFGKLLANTSDWKNQQYISMPYSDSIDEVGDAESYFDDKVSFVLSDTQFGNRLALFACGGQPIAAPYVKRNLEIDMQSKALQYVSANQPEYTAKHAALIEDELDKIINGSESVRGYVQKGWIKSGSASVLLEDDDFVATGEIEIEKAGALWRIDATITEI